MIISLFQKLMKLFQRKDITQLNLKKKKKASKPKYNSQKKERYLYKSSLLEFRLSRSRLENFLKCKRCFYLDRKLGVDKPQSYPFRLNSAVDELLKKEFDLYRERQQMHPYCAQNDINALPFDHEDMDKWRDSLHHGVEYKVPNTNLIFHGGLDDVWVDKSTGELIVVDYKATSQKDDVGIEADWQISYKRQMEMYQWLLRKNGFRVSDTAHFVYCNGKTDVNGFDNQLEFKVSIIPYEGDDSWVEQTILDAYECLLSDSIPMIEETKTCDYCQYLQAVNQHVLKQKYIN